MLTHSPSSMLPLGATGRAWLRDRNSVALKKFVIKIVLWQNKFNHKISCTIGVYRKIMRRKQMSWITISGYQLPHTNTQSTSNIHIHIHIHIRILNNAHGRVWIKRKRGRKIQRLVASYFAELELELKNPFWETLLGILSLPPPTLPPPPPPPPPDPSVLEEDMWGLKISYPRLCKRYNVTKVKQ